MNNHQLLVYPPGKKEQCFKCENTGYKPFDFGTGWKGDDPNHPCRKCWSKFGKAFTSVLQHSLGTNQSVAPSNYQRPLRLLETPGQNPVHYGGLSTSNQQQRPVVFTTQRPHIDVLGNTLVVRPGDPRIGEFVPSSKELKREKLTKFFLKQEEYCVELVEEMGYRWDLLFSMKLVVLSVEVLEECFRKEDLRINDFKFDENDFVLLYLFYFFFRYYRTFVTTRKCHLRVFTINYVLLEGVTLIN